MARLARHVSSLESGSKQTASSQGLGAPVPIESFILPIDHPHARPGLQKSSGGGDAVRSSSRKPLEIYDEEQKRPGLHKKTKSSVSLKSLLIGEKEKTKTSKAKDFDKDVAKKPKKTKSSTSLSAIFSRPKSLKDSKANPVDTNKENQTPPRTADSTSVPIWAQYATHIPEPPQGISKVPLNDSYEIAQEISLYTPANYSPSKQRNFHEHSRPTLINRDATKPRPKSDLLPSSPSTNVLMGTLARLRKRSDDISRETDAGSRPMTRSSSRRSSFEKALLVVRRTSQSKDQEAEATARGPNSKRSSRVMAAVAALQGKHKESTQASDMQKPTPLPSIDPRAIDDALEQLLVRPSNSSSDDVCILRSTGSSKHPSSCSGENENM